jgi:hypothetical protein
VREREGHHGLKRGVSGRGKVQYYARQVDASAFCAYAGPAGPVAKAVRTLVTCSDLALAQTGVQSDDVVE